MTTFPLKVFATRITLIEVIAYGYEEQVNIHLDCCDIKDLLDQLTGDLQVELFQYLKDNIEPEELKERLGL